MAISNLWQGRTGRLLYLVGLIISSAAIAVLPFVAGKIIAATVAGGPDPALAILRSLLYPIVIGIGLFIAGVAGAFASPGARFSPMVASAIGSASGLLGVFVQMFLTASTIRRLHDLNQRGWWIILFPFGLVSLTFFFALVPMLANPQLLATMLFNPLLMVTSVQGLGCLILLVRLLLTGGRDPDNVYGPPVNPPASSYLPA